MDEPWQQAAVHPNLLPGERILSTGRADPGRLFAPADIQDVSKVYRTIAEARAGTA